MAGSIKYRGKGKDGRDRWLAQVYVGERDGKKKYVSKLAYGDKEEAEKLLEILSISKNETPSENSLQTIGDKWLKNFIPNKVTGITLRDYTRYYDNKIVPKLGNKDIYDISDLDIQELYDEMKKTPRATRYTHVVLHSIMVYAISLGIIRRNPCDLVTVPRQTRKELIVLSQDEVKVFLSAAKGNDWGLLFEFLLMTGLRPNEAYALRWSDIIDNRVYVQRTLDRFPDRWEWGDTKTPKSRRNVPLPNSTQRRLKEYKVKQNEARLSLGSKYNSHNLIFASRLGEPLHHSNIARRYFKPLLIAAKLPDIRIYDLRHTCATMLLLAGVNPKIVSERLGHASISITLDIYSHVLPNMQQEATDKLETMFYSNEG
jgi:integrase